MQHIKFTDLARFQSKQKDAWFSLLNPSCKYLLYGGAAFGGKSYWLRWAAIGLGMYYYAKYGFRNVPIGLFSEDYPTLKDRQVIKMKTEIPSFLGRLVESRDEGYIFRATKEYGSFLILLRNLDDPSKYSSVEFAAELVEELTKNPRTTFDDLRFRLRYPGITDVKFAAATNPGGIGHGFVKGLFVKPDAQKPDGEQKRFFYVPAKYSDNKFTTDDYVAQLDALPDAKRRAYKDGDWDQFAGQVFEEWRDYVYIIKRFIPLKQSTLVGGLDWGRAKPFSLHLGEIQNLQYKEINFRRVKPFLELYGTNKKPKEWAKLCLQRLQGFGLTVKDIDNIQCDNQIFDPLDDGSESIYDQFVAENEDFRGIMQRASKNRIAGKEAVHYWLSMGPDGLPLMQVSEDCTNLIRTLPELVYDKNKVEDVDTDGEDHAYDSLRYMVKKIPQVDFKAGTVESGSAILEEQSEIQEEKDLFGEDK